MTKHRVTRRLLAVALSVLLVLGCVAPAVAATYESGTYTGTGTGRNGSVALTLTLTNGAIASVDNVTHSETARYWEKAKVLLDRLVGLQTPEQVEKLDAVTGATLSSNAIKEAAKDVFRQAESKETPVFASGSGTKSDPYLIRTAAQLQAFAAAVNGGTGYEGQYISLDADLDLTGTAWTPIGATGSFNGSFNGNYHTITGMTIGSESEKASYTEAGLFGSVGKGAAIRNVGVINAAIYNKTTTDPSVGLLAAGISENSIVESCWATGTIYSDTTSPYYSYVGGLVGSFPPLEDLRPELPIAQDGTLEQLGEKRHEQRDPSQVPLRRDGAPVDVRQVGHRLEGEKGNARRQRDGGHCHIHAQRRQIAQQEAGVLIIPQHEHIEHHRRGIYRFPVPPSRGREQRRRPVAHAGHRERRQQPHAAPAVKRQAEQQQHQVPPGAPTPGHQEITKQRQRQKAEQKGHTAKSHNHVSPFAKVAGLTAMTAEPRCIQRGSKQSTPPSRSAA